MTAKISNRIISILLCVCLLMSYLPISLFAANAGSGASGITTVADPETLTRPETIYGDSTVNAGKITVGKSVSDTDITVNGQNIAIDGENNFLVTISQSAQVMGLTSEVNVPLDVVIVFDTSGSMGNDSNGNGKNRTQELVEAANRMIASLMEMNELNRVGVVAFSAHNAGGGTAGYNAANVLSELAHYEDEAATQHLTWTTGQGPSWAPTVQLVQGRSTTNGVRNSRYGTGGATNIQAGVTLGAQLLLEADTTVTINDQQITRTPILILMSDGAPTVSAYENQWWNASQTNNQGPTNAPFMGNGFLTVLTASYFKNQITRHYYGDNAEKNACSIYTVGVELSDTATQDTVEEVDLSYMTLNPTGEFVPGSDNYYYDRNTAADSFLDAWNSYQAGEEFSVRVWSNQTRHDGYYYFYNSAKTLTNANDYKNGADTWTTVGRSTVQPNILSSVTTLQYNDKFYDVDDVSQLTDALDDMLTEIARKAITVPTKVTSGDHNFDGYVTFTDPIGEYMEVKDMKGVLAGGYFYQGASFAKYLKNYGTASANGEFDTLLRKVIKTRMGLSAADSRFASEAELDAFIDSLLRSAQSSEHQANYVSDSNFDNSFVWWGKHYDAGEEDKHVQLIGFADNDSIDYIQAQNAAGLIPADADCVCRSYFFYGEAGGANPDPDHEYLYFMVRVQRELTAPYRETVVISAPASLLSMEKVLVNESFDADGNRIYTASVEHQEPARVVYEVGLWDSINAENAAYVVSQEYASETVNGTGSVNYDPDTDTYYFFTNDWDRSQSLSSHHRGMAKATFDAAADNSFYTYQEDTLLVDKNGNPVTADPSGKTVYYVREYYTWPADGKQDGTYSAAKESVLIEVAIPAGTQLIHRDGKWYIPAGTYTAATLVVNGDDTEKSVNATGTSSIVAHPHRTGDSDNSHYTVFLGNNGKLGLQADPYEPVKTVSVNLSEDAVSITDDEGKAVQVGDVLTYTVEVKNFLDETADLTVTDYVPLGTAFVAGSAGSGTGQTGHTQDASIQPDSNNVLTWVLEDVPAGQTRYVSFRVTVTEAALSLSIVPGSIENTAKMQLDKLPAVSTNTTHNPPYGKAVSDVNNQNIDGGHGFRVGDILVYHIRFHNTAKDENGQYVAANVTVTDKIPAGTTFLSADQNGSFDAATGIVTWKFDNMAADSANIVSFRVQINAGAKIAETGTQPETGEIYLPNTAIITVENDPQVTFTTNTIENWADVGDMVITKTVADGGDQSRVFTLELTEASGLLDGIYVLKRGNREETVVFTAGKALVTIAHGETLTVKGLPAGVIITVTEDVSALPGWTPAYNTQSVTIAKGEATTVSSVSITNTYYLQPLTLTLNGIKHLRGIDLPKDATVGFVAEPDSGNTVAGDPLTGEVTVKETGEYHFSFSPKTITRPGVYKYTISEISGGMLGMTYDETRYVLVITAVDNGDGTLRATAQLDGAAFDFTQDAVSFTNTYVPEDTQLVLTANKILSGRTLSAGEFRFRLTDGTNTYQGINDEQGKIVFETIPYTAAGTYTYTLSEVIPANADTTVSYDTKTYTVVVVVSDENGQLVPKVTVDGSAKIAENGGVDTGVTFLNSFEPNDVPLILTAKKTLMVYDPATESYVPGKPAAGAFRFQITDQSTGNVVTTGTNDGSGSIVFNAIYFTDEMLAEVSADSSGTRTKTFTYVISELEPVLDKDPNMVYDLAGREIQVTLTYTANGILTVSVGQDSDGSVDLSGSVNFVNYSNPDSVEIHPVGTKTTANAPSGVSFSFSVINTQTGNEAAAGVGDANGSITFSAMSFSQPGSYTYWIKESNAGNTTNGITYDNTRYLMQVVVSRNSNNRLIAEVTYWSSMVDGSENVSDYTISAAAPSFHNVYEAGGYINLTARKSLSGRTLNDGEFAFKLIRQDNGGEIDGIAAADGTVTFSTMYYSLADIPAGEASAVIHYVMSEVVPTNAGLPGVTYDKTSYDVYVRITNNGSGAILTELVKPDGDSFVPVTDAAGNPTKDTGVVFRNTYQAVNGDSVKFYIKKNLSGRDLRPGEFEFLLSLNGSVVDIATNDANGIVTFTREIAPTVTPGTYELVITEAPGQMAGVTFDSASYKVYIKVTDDGKGNIVATLVDAQGKALPETNGAVDLTGSVIFNNTYEAHDTSYTPVAEKLLTGRDLIAGEFHFKVEDLASGTVYNGVNAADGTVVFQSISYTDAGTYRYRITEVSPTDPVEGMTYDAAQYYLQVVVEDNGNGYLAVTSAGYYSDAAMENAVTGVTFQNSYVPKDIAVQLQATKELTGRPMADKEFSFVVRKDHANGEIVAVGSNDKTGNILFSTFDITAKDMQGQTSKTFTYVVTESDNNIPGVTVDKTVYTVTVTVTDDGTGVLSAAVNYPQPIVFRNVYTPGSVKLPLVAFKTLLGMDLAQDAFTFELKDSAGQLVQSVTNGKNGTVALEALTFTAADMVDENGDRVMNKVFTYTLTEKTGDMDGMEYDSTVYTITVTVTDDGKGNLTAAAAYHNGREAAELLSFTNRYTPPAIEVEIQGTKAIVDGDGKLLTGDGYALAGFEFEVYDVTGKLVTTAVSDENGNITFTGFRFTEAGEYRFLFSEKTTDRPGYSTDPAVWCVHITIGYAADTGVLYERNEFVHLAPESHSDMVAQGSQSLQFVNVYDPADVHLTLKVRKVLTGRELKDHEFTFYMVDQATGLRAAEASNHANGDVNFSLTYTKAGTYVYTVYEYIPAEGEQLGGMQYSTAKYKVTVEVTDDGSGALKAQVGKVTAVGEATVDLTGSVVFYNTYDTDPVEVTVEAMKRLDGKALEENTYRFTLVNTEDPTEQYTAFNAADGKITFAPISYAAAGTYVYTLSEEAGQEPGVIYDDHIYTVTVTVTDQGNGKLTAAVHYTNSDGGVEAVAVFHNIYQPEPVEYAPEVLKIYEGDTMRTFAFVLSGEGFDTQTKQNDADGRIFFDTLTFASPGSYSFTIVEQIDPNLDDIKWDTNVYTLVFEIIDDGAGKLVIDKLTVTSENGRNDLVFRNVHESIITHKDVFMADDLTVSIDGFAVEKGDILTYTISYHNYTGLPGNVTITDTIPAYTAYVDGSADNGGSLSGDTLTWNLTDVPSDETVTVSFRVEVTGSSVEIENQAAVLEGSNTYTTNIVHNPVPEDEIRKDVFHISQPEVSIDGETVENGDTLLYKITYTNADDFAGDVTITDTIPQHTVYVDGSADNGGTFADGVLTWNVRLEAGESITVSFQVQVNAGNVVVVNQAFAVEGENTLETNIVENPVPQDEIRKDVFHISQPQISIDGKQVKCNDILLYKLTYTNSFDAAADVTITDAIPAHTTYVNGSADNGGTFADGVLTWNVRLEAGESITVSFRVKVVEEDVTVVNQASALEGGNKLDSNIVENPVPGPGPETPQTGDLTGIHLWLVLLLASAGGILSTAFLGKRKKETSDG